MKKDSQSLFTGTWKPLRGPFARWPRTADSLLAVVVFLVTLVVSEEGANRGIVSDTTIDIPLTAYGIFAVSSAALIWRRSRPLETLGVVWVTSALSMALGYFDGPLIATVVSLYGAGRYANNDHWSYIWLAATVALVGISEQVGVTFSVEIGVVLLLPLLLWYVGKRIRARGDYVGLLQERAVRLEREQTAEACRIVTEERTRIARELHDVVAHRVSLMTVQAGAATTVAARDPEAALQAMKAVESEGRQALNELRHLMGVLRPEAEVGRLGPQPGIADIPRLVEGLKDAGLDIELAIPAAETELPARVDLFAYRIVQEALTNVLKHAGPGARTSVRLRIDKHRVAIEVLDNGQSVTILPGSGHGIVGMRERAQLLSGSLDAGPRPDGGFRVSAELPLGSAPT